MTDLSRLLVLISGGFLAGLLLVSCVSEQGSSNSGTMAHQPDEFGLAYLGSETCLECHDEGLGGLMASTHWVITDPRTPGAQENGCESCHGPGEQHFEMDGDIDVPGMVTFGKNANVSATRQNQMCLSCHQSDLNHWQGSLHDSDDIACTDCHTLLHGGQTRNKLREQTFCYDCHANVRAETYRPFRHPIREELLQCTDCHNPHGSPGPALLNQLSLNDNCYSCHAEKRGPYLWEHEPVVDDCNACHVPHGSLHPGLLRSRPPLLCQQCHQSSRITHVRQGFYFGKPPALKLDGEHGEGHGGGTGPIGDGHFGGGGSDSGGTGSHDDNDGNGPGDGTGSGTGGDGHGDSDDGNHDDNGAGHEDGSATTLSRDETQTSEHGDQEQDQEQGHDQEQDQHQDQDRRQEGPGSDNVIEGGSSRFLQGSSCLSCHSQVHGSNHPSGSKLMR